MNQGEFALGSTSHGYGGYLFYLDIGANAKKINSSIFQKCGTINYNLKPHKLCFKVGFLFYY